MDRRTRHGERPEDKQLDEGYRASILTPIDDDDEWWLPNEADVTAPDAPFHYRPGEGPPGHERT